MESVLPLTAWLPLFGTIGGILLLFGYNARIKRQQFAFGDDYQRGGVDPLGGRPRMRWRISKAGSRRPTFTIEDLQQGHPLGTFRVLDRRLFNVAELDLGGRLYRIESPPRRSAVPDHDSAMWRDDETTPIAAASPKLFGGGLSIDSTLGNLELRFIMDVGGRRQTHELWRDGSLIGIAFPLPKNSTRFDFMLADNAAPLAAFVFYQMYARGGDI